MEALALGLDDRPEAGLRLLQAGPRTPITGSLNIIGRESADPAISAPITSVPSSAEPHAFELDTSHFGSGAGEPRYGTGWPVHGAATPLGLAYRAVGVKALAVGASSPVSASAYIRTGDLTDRALAAHFDGHLGEAAKLGRLAAERASRGVSSPLFVPGFDEMAPRPTAGSTGRIPSSAPASDGLANAGITHSGVPAPDKLDACCMPAELRLAETARTLVLSACGSGAVGSGEGERFLNDYARAADISASLSSHYERARTEFVLGRACAVRGRTGAAREGADTRVLSCSRAAVPG